MGSTPLTRLDIQAPASVKERHDVVKDPAVAMFLDSTPQAAATWIETNVNNLAQTKALLKVLTRIVIILARHVLTNKQQ